jgi:Na+/citrate or Na+/malate symporter
MSVITLPSLSVNGAPGGIVPLEETAYSTIVSTTEFPSYTSITDVELIANILGIICHLLHNNHFFHPYAP